MKLRCKVIDKAYTVKFIIQRKYLFFWLNTYFEETYIKTHEDININRKAISLKNEYLESKYKGTQIINY